ncbi:hypothetical protein U1Q18_028173 [Sarracenia purpurea var. burkii]
MPPSTISPPAPSTTSPPINMLVLHHVLPELLEVEEGIELGKDVVEHELNVLLGPEVVEGAGGEVVDGDGGGAKTVMPWLALLSWFSIWSATWVDIKRRGKVVYWPPFSRITEMLIGSADEDGTGVAGDWA